MDRRELLLALGVVGLCLAAGDALAGDRAAPTAPSPVKEWVTTPSGLKIADIVVGSGAAAAAGSNVKVDYTGWIADANGHIATKFDSSLDRTEPIELPLGKGRIIAGWEEGLLGMKVGGRRVLLIPPGLAYGERGAGKVVPPNATLLFEVELVSMTAARMAPAAPTPVDSRDYVTTGTGLKYYDHVVGTGAEPSSTKARVTVEYTGWLMDGRKFDSSYDRDDSFTFYLDQVIKGWAEGVSTMRVGGKRQLVIPPNLGYGAKGAGGMIPGNATLVFEVELLAA